MAGLLPLHYDPTVSKPEVVVVREAPLDGVGLDSYRFAYELSDGQTRNEQAQVEARANPEESVLRVYGSFSWVDPADGQTYTVNYIADENGFQPQGAHLPVA
ncbi:endocuticle structural protein SgAbd-6-like [Phymastichus coffea]|uniref:endocuticle structural protein SgAbd-6-like n=1 Tax=Phymastichus coffea TaxID=108790 RepID=UPI00273B3C5F|nr:endocuticle structural protein SgAbd-6-like [Phymastichus coffea]